MPLISIRRYLDHFQPGQEADSGPSVYAQACDSVIGSVDLRLLDGPGYSSLKPKWGGLSQMLALLDGPDGLAEFQVRISEVLAERQALESERERKQGQDVRHMLGVLNDALLTLATGSENSVDRLRRLEKTLHRTSQLNDLVAMKTSLTETMRLIREETEQTRTEGAGTLKRLEPELEKARTASRRLPGLPGRVEAIQRLAEASVPGAPAWLAVACRLEQVRIVQSRYGASVADSLLMAFADWLVQHDGDEVFRWAEDSLVIFHRTEETAKAKRSQLEVRFGRPFEHKVMTGGRGALLSVAIRWICASPAEAGHSSVTDEFESFFEGRQWRP